MFEMFRRRRTTRAVVQAAPLPPSGPTEVDLPRSFRQGSLAELQAAGVQVLGGTHRYCFRAVLPAGWTVNLETGGVRVVRDERGRKRAMYEFEFQLGEMRSASIWLVGRYSVSTDCNTGEHPTYSVTVMDNDENVRLFYAELDVPGMGYFVATEMLQNQAVAWLLAKFPDWKNPNAYR